MAPLVARAAARGAELVLLPEKWNAVADGPELRPLRRAAGRRRDRRRAGRLGARAPHRPDLRQHRHRGRGRRPGVGNVSIAFDRTATGRRRLHQDPPVRRRRRRDQPTASRTARRPAPTRWSPSSTACRSASPSATTCASRSSTASSTDRGRAGADRARELHAAHRHGALGAAAPRAGDREPVLRARRRPARDSRAAGAGRRYGHSMIIDPWGTVLAAGARRRRRDRRRARSGRPAAHPRAASRPPSPGASRDPPDPIFNSREDPPNG